MWHLDLEQDYDNQIWNKNLEIIALLLLKTHVEGGSQMNPTNLVLDPISNMATTKLIAPMWLLVEPHRCYRGATIADNPKPTNFAPIKLKNLPTSYISMGFIGLDSFSK